MRFDKLKLVFNNKYITSINKEKFSTTYESGQVTSYRYTHKSPFMLGIKIDVQRAEAALEFTGKILGKHYPKLISSETIRECLDNIQSLGVCRLDIDGILTTAEVPRLDVTKDVEVNFEDCVMNLELAIKNNKRWQIEKYQGSHGRVVRKNVSSAECKRRLVIYDKAKELAKNENKEFLEYAGREEMLNAFQGITRFELNLTSRKQIQQLLKIEDNRLMSVLNSSANPLLTVIEEAFDFSKTEKKDISVNDWYKLCALEKCNNDLSEVERNIRRYVSKNTSITKMMAPFRKLATMINCKNSGMFDLKTLLAV